MKRCELQVSESERAIALARREFVIRALLSMAFDRQSTQGWSVREEKYLPMLRDHYSLEQIWLVSSLYALRPRVKLPKSLNALCRRFDEIVTLAEKVCQK